MNSEVELSEIEINIERYQKDQNFSKVTIDDKIRPPITIQTTLVESRRDDLVVKQWILQIKKSHASNIIGFSAESSQHYRNATHINLDARKNGAPFEILQLCIGNQCLLFRLDDYWFEPKNIVPKVLRDLLSDDGFLIVGVGMEEVAKKLESQLGLKISQARDLRKLAAFADGNGGDYYKKYSLVKLATRVLDRDWKKPPPMDWWKVYRRTISDDKIKYGTVEAFLAYEMGKKLLN